MALYFGQCACCGQYADAQLPGSECTCTDLQKVEAEYREVLRRYPHQISAPVYRERYPQTSIAQKVQTLDVVFDDMIILGGPVHRNIMDGGETTFLGMTGSQEMGAMFCWADDVDPSEAVHLPSLQTGLYHHPSRTFLKVKGDPLKIYKALSGILNN